MRYLTAGESHGKALLALVDGFPSGVTIDPEKINADLALRQGGYGRGGRQSIETDRVEILSGIWHGQSIGSPIALLIPNRDYKIEKMDDLESPRPGHGDLAGSIKYAGSIRGILERASARETAARVAAGSLAKILLDAFHIRVLGYVTSIGGLDANMGKIGEIDNASRRVLRDQSELYTLIPEQDAKFKGLIDTHREAGDTLGGVLEIRVEGLPIGLGTHAQWDRKLDGRIAQAVAAVQAIKGVEIGFGFESARHPGSEVHDAIAYDARLYDTPHQGWYRPTNRAGGLEAGMTNSEPLVVRAAMKPIPTLRHGIPSVTLASPHEPVQAAYERSDVCAVSAAAIVLECVVAFTVAEALTTKFSGDSLTEMRRMWNGFHSQR